MVHEQMTRFYTGFRRDAHPMAVMVGVVGALSAFYHNSIDIKDPDQRDIAAIRMIAKMPTIAAMAYKYSIGQPFIYPRNELRYSANFLHMCFAVPCEEYKVDPILARAMDRIFILHADHEQNASTSTVRLAGSSGANPFACISAGIACLWGPAHGGANEAALQMLQEIGTVDRIPEFIKRAKDKNDPFRLMGFGHRVYKNYDPRAKIMQKTCHEVLDAVGHQRRSDPEGRDRARADRALRRLFHPEEALSQYRLLFRHHAEGAGLSDRHVHGAVRHRADGRLDRAVEGDDRGSDRSASAGRGSSILERPSAPTCRWSGARRRPARSAARQRETVRARSAAAMVAARSAISTCPAARAMPARPAAAAFLTVSGPMVGRSTRSSWPGFGALTSTPASRALLEPADLAQLGAAGEHGVGALGGFDGQHVALGDHGRLPDIEARRAP